MRKERYNESNESIDMHRNLGRARENTGSSGRVLETRELWLSTRITESPDVSPSPFTFSTVWRLMPREESAERPYRQHELLIKNGKWRPSCSCS